MLRDPGVFDVAWVPGDLRHRNEELRDLASILNTYAATPVCIIGPSGTGKTATVHDALTDMDRHAEGVATAYTDAWDQRAPLEPSTPSSLTSLLVAACLSGFLEFDLCVSVLAEHPLEGDVGKHFLPADGAPEELEQCLTVSVKYFETHWLTHPAVPGHHLVPDRKTAPSGSSPTHRSVL